MGGQAGETDLAALLRTMRPSLSATEYGFGTLPPAAAIPTGLHPFATVAEDEGLTLVAPAADLVRAAVPHSPGWARISLAVHSSLSAVGLTARIASALAEAGISANVVAGYFHDHFFVQWPRRHDAMAVLARLSAGD